MITQAELIEKLHYDPSVGVFTWRHRNGAGRIPKDMRAGSAAGAGYLVICINQRRYYAHRLAWFYVHGEWPEEVDHINGDKTDNRIGNLRVCTRSQNLFNRAKMPSNSSGFKGVRWNQTGWAARIQVNRKVENLGTFKTKEAARDAYNQAALRLHGEFARID